jgi:hypothetical protein
MASRGLSDAADPSMSNELAAEQTSGKIYRLIGWKGG